MIRFECQLDRFIDTATTTTCCDYIVLHKVVDELVLLLLIDNGNMIVCFLVMWL